MAEIKQNFSAGKMNKDLDERLLPKGQYRHAENIQVSTSEDSDVGAIENILSNSIVPGQSNISNDATCITTIADEKNNKVYWFVKGNSVPGAGLSNTSFQDPDGFVTYTQEEWNSSPYSTNWVVDDKWFIIADGTGLSYNQGITNPHTDHGITIVNGVAVRDNTNNGTNSSLRQNVDIVSGVEYTVSYKRKYVSGNSTTNIFIDFGNGNQGVANSNETSGSYVTVEDTFIATTTGTMEFRVYFIGDFVGEIDDVTITTTQQAGRILEYDTKTNIVTPVFVDLNNSVLKFDSDNIITGVNIIDDLLFWTDNINEPKKINIYWCKEGTVDEITNTKLIVPQRDIDLASDIDIREEHITVIKKSPIEKITLDMEGDFDVSAQVLGFVFEEATVPYEVGDIVDILDIQLNAGDDFRAGDLLYFTDIATPISSSPTGEIVVKVIKNISGTLVPPPDSAPSGPTATLAPEDSYKVEIIETNSNITTTDWNVYKEANVVELFEKDFSRFSYRYKYRDGEYSTFAPFSDLAFLPSTFDYETKKAYNLGMQNALGVLKLTNFINSDLLENVVQVDLLYKKSNSPNVYIVEKLKFKDFKNLTILTGTFSQTQAANNWTANFYEIQSDTIYSTISSNQLLRPYDNVPLTAKAQEITGNRIVYGNYTQNYDLDTKPLVDVSLIERSISLTSSVGEKSLKSSRNYQLGIVYLDKYGRQTPVFSSSRSSLKIPKEKAEKSNSLEFSMSTSAPSWASHYKMYIKETSSEYYNLAMDRVYKAKDGNIWMSFPSSERNKIDEETFLILKKQIDSDTQVDENLRYKVIAIENEAPVEVKTNNVFVSSSNGTGDIELLFSGIVPQIDLSSFEIHEPTFKLDGGPSIDNITETLAIVFKDISNDIVSEYYEIANIIFAAPHYTITLTDKIKEKDNWIYTDYATLTSYTKEDLNDNLSISIYKQVRKEQPEFDGRFFVKILNDYYTEKYVLSGLLDPNNFLATANVSAFYLSDTAANYDNSLISLADLQGGVGTVSGVGNSNSDTRGDWENNCLQFNNGTVSSGWFIDQVRYTSKHASVLENTLDGSAGSRTMNSNYDFGHGQGIYKDPTTDQWYMELSFSQILPNAEDRAGIHSLSILSGNTIGGSGGISNTPLISALTLNVDSLQTPNLFAVGSSINPSHANQAEVVASFVENKLFKFNGDVNKTKYIINGSVVREERYNYTSFADVKNKHDELMALIGAGTLTNVNIGGSQVDLTALIATSTFNDLEDLWDDFAESTNRRVTYIIPFAKYDPNASVISGQTIYDSADPNTNSTFVNSSGSNYDLLDKDDGADEDTAISIQFIEQNESEKAQIVSENPAIWETEPKENVDLDIYYEASKCYDISSHGTTQQLDWFNCYSFGNGVESNRIRDDFNQVTIDKGAVASSTIDFVYEKENRKNGLIYSGIYNSTSGVNNLNQFIAAEKITKDINPTYGSIQKLFSRNTDLITFCEDKVVKVLANKDAVFNADGNPQLIATQNVLGQTIPFVGDYGISQNPESFAKESYRAYFTDKNRGKVLRLSRDGITPISDYGMSKYFKDQLKTQDKLIGSYDQKKNEYNLSLQFNTVSYDEKVKGWSSFKSFVPEQGVSVTNFYYTFKNGNLYKHHDDDAMTWNNFYGTQYESKVNTILNDSPSDIKSFKTINYEGSQSNIVANLNDSNYYNLYQKDGWKLEKIITDKETGFVPEFIEKEGKWFNNVKGDNITTKQEIDTSSFSFQGIGKPSSVQYFNVPQAVDVIVEAFLLPNTNTGWFVTNNSNQVLYRRGIFGSSNMFNDPNEPLGSQINPNLVAEQIFGGNVYRQGETVDEIVQFKIRPGIDLGSGNAIIPIQASEFSTRNIAPPGPDSERSRAFDENGDFIENIQVSDGAGGAIEDKGLNDISANVSFVDTDIPSTNDNHVLLNVPIKFTVPQTPGIDTIRIELYIEKT